MPHKHSPEKRYMRRQRALCKGYLQQRDPGHSHICVPKEIQDPARIMVSAYHSHLKLDRLTSKEHHFLMDAANDARPLLGEEEYRRIRRLNERAGTVKHNPVQSSATSVSHAQIRPTLQLASLVEAQPLQPQPHSGHQHGHPCVANQPYVTPSSVSQPSVAECVIVTSGSDSNLPKSMLGHHPRPVAQSNADTSQLGRLVDSLCEAVVALQKHVFTSPTGGEPHRDFSKEANAFIKAGANRDSASSLESTLQQFRINVATNFNKLADQFIEQFKRYENELDARDNDVSSCLDRINERIEKRSESINKELEKHRQEFRRVIDNLRQVTNSKIDLIKEASDKKLTAAFQITNEASTQQVNQTVSRAATSTFVAMQILDDKIESIRRTVSVPPAASGLAQTKMDVRSSSTPLVPANARTHAPFRGQVAIGGRTSHVINIASPSAKGDSDENLARRSVLPALPHGNVSKGPDESTRNVGASRAEPAVGRLADVDPMHEVQRCVGEEIAGRTTENAPAPHDWVLSQNAYVPNLMHKNCSYRMKRYVFRKPVAQVELKGHQPDTLTKHYNKWSSFGDSSDSEGENLAAQHSRDAREFMSMYSRMSPSIDNELNVDSDMSISDDDCSYEPNCKCSSCKDERAAQKHSFSRGCQKPI